MGDAADDQRAPGADEDLLARLRASEELYARTFLANPVAMSLTNADTDRFTHINSAFAELVGHNRADIIGRTSEELGFWPDRSQRDGVRRRLNESDVFPIVRGAVRKKGGETVPVLCSFRLLAFNGTRCVLSILVPIPPE